MNKLIWINFQTDRQLKKRLEIMAKAHDRSMSSFMRTLVQDAWDQFILTNEKAGEDEIEGSSPT